MHENMNYLQVYFAGKIFHVWWSGLKGEFWKVLDQENFHFLWYCVEHDIVLWVKISMSKQVSQCPVKRSSLR